MDFFRFREIRLAFMEIRQNARNVADHSQSHCAAPRWPPAATECRRECQRGGGSSTPRVSTAAPGHPDGGDCRTQAKRCVSLVFWLDRLDGHQAHRAHELDGRAHELDDRAHELDGRAHELDDRAHELDDRADGLVGRDGEGIYGILWDTIAFLTIL